MTPGNKVYAKLNKAAAVNSALATQLLGTKSGSECTSWGAVLVTRLWQRKSRVIN